MILPPPDGIFSSDANRSSPLERILAPHTNHQNGTPHRTRNVTAEIQAVVRESGCAEGVCRLYVPHTTAAVLINEGYDPDVARDMEVALDKLVPRSGNYAHAEGNSDSHIKTALIGSSETVWIEGARLMLGRWQAIFFAEFDGPRTPGTAHQDCP